MIPLRWSSQEPSSLILRVPVIDEVNLLDQWTSQSCFEGIIAQMQLAKSSSIG